MVQPQGEKGESLRAKDYLLPLTTLRDALLRPQAESNISRGTVKGLLQHYVERLKKPWEPFKKASASSRSAVQSSSITIPETKATLDVVKGSRKIALQLSDATEMDEVDAFIMWESYASHSIEDTAPGDGQSHEDALMDRLLLWYEQELLAVPQIVMALYVPSSEPTGWEEVAADLRVQVLGEQSAYIEELFRAFSVIAQRPVESKLSRSLYWATLQLRQQETLLDLLFLILYQYTTRPAVVSEGLVKGTVLSSFGTAQANGEIWETDEECQRLQLRIRDLLLVIAVEALCLAQIVSPESEDEGDRFGATLLHSRDSIHAVHQFIMEQSEDLEAPPEADEIIFPTWPMPVLCLAWAVVLRSLPANLQPPSGDYFNLDTTDMNSDEHVVYLGAASRALRISSGLFPWLEVILSGPLFQASKDAFSGDLAVDMAALRRSPLKDLLIGLSELLHIQNIVDRMGLYRAWDLLFGGGSYQASTSLSTNYWDVDFVYDDRRAILDESHFPREATYLPRLLAALTGVSTDDEIDFSFEQGTTVSDVYEYFSDLPAIVVAARPLTYMNAGVEGGREIVEAAVDLELPGGMIIPRRTRGVVLSRPDDEVTVVSWRGKQPAWSLLIEILRGAAGFTPAKATSVSTRRLTLVDLGVQGDLPDILSAGLKFLRCVLRSPEVANRFMEDFSFPGDGFPGQALLDLALNVASDRDDVVAAQHSIEILQALLLTGSSEIWQAFRASGFFDSHSRRQGSVATLIRSDAMRGQHGLTVALLRLVRSIASANSGDPLVVRSAVRLIFSEVWSQFLGWRYRDVSERYEIATLLTNIFDTILRHPLGEDGKSPSPAAAHLIETFITGGSLLTYKPMIDVFTQSVQAATKFAQAHRWTDVSAVFSTFDQTASLLATLIRLAPSLSISTSALPYSVFASTVVLTGGEKIQLVDALFDLISRPSLQPTSLRLIIRLIKVYLETTAGDASRPSLAGILRNGERTCAKVAEVAFSSALNDVKPDAWALLGMIIATQPGCARFCFGDVKDKKLEGPLGMASEEVLGWKHLWDDGPRALSAILNYCQAVLQCPSASSGVAALRGNSAFWQAIYDISIKHVPLPSSFSDRMAVEVQEYSYKVQAKANASALFATELSQVQDQDGPETKAQSLALSLFRNKSLLEDVGLGAVHTSCDPPIHEAEDTALRANGVSLIRLRTICLPDERDFGIEYLYDGNPVIFNDHERQMFVNRSLAILNMNWSQLDADITFTKAWRLLAEAVSTWTAGDGLAALAALQASGAIAGVLANEDHGGDVMLAIQTERLGILATLLETALDPETEAAEPTIIKELANNVRKIVESSLFSPILSLRHKELPPIHRPVLRILLLLSQANSGKAADHVHEVLFDSGASFALEAADIILDTIVREPDHAAEQDLGLVVALLCEMSRGTTATLAWQDKLQQVNLIPRSLEVIVRTRPVNNVLPAHFHIILLLHLAIASSTHTAEKLAMSGVLPAYADNVIAVAAEQARIDSSDNESLHRAWCSMLMVVEALLSTLPSAASYARSDVVPFVRVVMPQLLRALAWDGETPLSAEALQELTVSADVFYGLASVLGTNAGPTASALFDDFALPAIDFIRGVRFAFSHPHRFCALIVPSTEEEQAALEKELEAVEAQKDDISLVDSKKMPVVAKRTAGLLNATRTVLVTLVRFTRTWEILDGDLNPKQEYLLPYDDEHSLSAASDPVGVVNDLYLLLVGIDKKLSAGNERATVTQATEAAALLSLTQLLMRRALHPYEDDTPTVDSMDIDMGKRRHSLSKPDRGAQIRRELESDVRGMLPETGDNKVLEVLRGVAVSRFSE